MPYSVGDTVDGFELPRAGGGTVAFEPTGSGATVIIWTANHCPYAMAWHDRVQSAIRDYTPQGVRFLQLNANDAEKYPADSFAAMEERVAAGDFASDYLRDEDQLLSKSWGARVTPDIFVIDATGKLVYRGAPDANWEDDSLNAEWLRSALDDVLAGRSVALAETKPKGCGIKWIVNDQPNPYI